MVGYYTTIATFENNIPRNYHMFYGEKRKKTIEATYPPPY